MVEERGKAAVAARVSRETCARLETIAALLAKWQKTLNLISPATLPDLWERHIADSLQLVNHVPATARRWVDLGSGGGFPGLVAAAVMAERAGARVVLVESDTRKAAFLREAARHAALPVEVAARRIEDVSATLAPGTDVVSARALAPLPKLLDLAAPFLAAGALGLFPKGRDAERELTEARKGWTLDIDLAPSLSDPDGRILVVRSARREAPVVDAGLDTTRQAPARPAPARQASARHRAPRNRP
jgi:16S rRNA (guanine527-N7)-methyltransferase